MEWQEFVWWWWWDFQCYGQGLLTACVVICLSFIQFSHQLSMMNQLFVPSSRIPLVQVLHCRINAFLLLRWHKGSQWSSFRSPSSQHSILPYYFCHLINSLGSLPREVKLRFSLIADPTNFSGTYTHLPSAWGLVYTAGNKAPFLRDPYPFTLSILYFLRFPPNSGKCRSLLHIK